MSNPFTWAFLIDIGESKESLDKPEERPYVGVTTLCRFCSSKILVLY